MRQWAAFATVRFWDSAELVIIARWAFKALGAKQTKDMTDDEIISAFWEGWVPDDGILEVRPCCMACRVGGHEHPQPLITEG